MSRGLYVLFFGLSLSVFAQTIEGRITDAVTKSPIESAAIYFDNTTRGTTTNAQGYFRLDYDEAIQSDLVISYLGYEKVYLSDYRKRKHVAIELTESADALETVYLDYDDGLTREQKLKLFRQEFLGQSKFGASCTIVNEEDLILRYNAREKSLSASAYVPVEVINKALGYRIRYDIKEFEAVFRYLNPQTGDSNLHSVMYQGTSYYEELEERLRKRTTKNRRKAYLGSVQHFMRALYHRKLEDQQFEIYVKGFKRDPWRYFTISTVEDSPFKKVTLSQKVSILFEKEQQSELQLNVPLFYVDAYGNHSPIQGVLFSGYMGFQRVGDILPSDYQP